MDSENTDPDNYRFRLDKDYETQYASKKLQSGESISFNYKIINNNPDGININEKCGSTHLEGLKEYVIKNKFSLRNCL